MSVEPTAQWTTRRWMTHQIVKSLHRVRVHFLVCAAVFFLFLLAGLFVTGIDDSTDVNEDVHIEPESATYLVKNNLSVLGLLVAGVFTLGITTLVNLSINGYLLGYVMASATASGVPPLAVVAMVLFHGVIEATAFFVGGAVGLYVPQRVLWYLRGDVDRVVTNDVVSTSVTLTIVAVVLVVVAALVESRVTPWAAETVWSMLIDA